MFFQVFSGIKAGMSSGLISTSSREPLRKKFHSLGLITSFGSFAEI